MIVNCDGCESRFHVDELLIKPAGSKVRCSKCRHVFLAYPPASVAEMAEPLNLTEEVPAADPLPAAAATDDVDLKLDALFQEDAADESLPAASSTRLEPLPADNLVETAWSLPEKFATEPLPDDFELDLDLDLDFDAKKAKSEPFRLSGSIDTKGLQESDMLPSLGITDTGGFGDFDIRPDAVPEPKTQSGEEPLSLDELELNLSELDIPAAGAAPYEPEASPLDAELELDFDLEALALEGDDSDASKAPEPALESAIEGTDADELAGAPGAGLGDMDLGFDAAAPVASRPDSEAVPKPSGVDELDLSDLEEMLEGVTPASSAQPSQADTRDVDFELDLSSEVAPDSSKSAKPEELDLAAITKDLDADTSLALAGDAIEEELELDFDLESDEGPVKIKEPATQASADELDFSDMAGILEGDALAVERTAGEKSDLDLMLEDGPAPAWMENPPLAEATTQRDLLSDIEALLKEDSDTDNIGGAPEPADMDIAIEPDNNWMRAQRFGEPVEAVNVAGDSAVLPAAEAVTDEFSTDEFTHSDIGVATNVLDLEPVGGETPLSAAARSGARKPLLVVLGALLLGIAALIIMRISGVSIPFLSDLDIQVPGIGNLFKSEPEDPAGNLKITPLSEKISADFFDNSSAGRLCVIRGEVRNTYDHPRSSIRVTAKLYTLDKMVAKSATVFAGNILSKEELANLDLITMNSRFNLKTGANNINTNIKPGDAVPFMVVFSNLPANLDEYSVEIAGSLK